MPRTAAKKPAAEKSPKADLLPALPGEAEVDEEALDQAVEKINVLYAQKGLETARVIGEYVLKTFFKGDPANFHGRGKKHVTFRKLAEREDLYPSYSWIWKAVSVVEQLRLLPEPIRDVLPWSHQTLLLPLKDAGQKVDLAEKAAKGGWSKRKLDTEVKKIRARSKKSDGVGRPPLPAFAKGLRQMIKAVEFATSETVNGESFAHYDPDVAKELLESVDEQIAKLQGLKKEVQAAIKEHAKFDYLPPCHL